METTSLQLTPRARYLYKRARNLQGTVGVYKKRVSLLQKQLSSARRVSSFICNPKKRALRNEAVKFCLQQLSRSHVKNKGQRYSLDEKLLSLAIYKTSGPAFRFLSKWFCLPSKRTMSKLLQNIDIKEGTSPLVMTNLKNCVKKLKEKERLCTLLFDEMALTPSIMYKKLADNVIGMADGKIADHVLVFMVRGVTRKWKQTVAYRFCKSSTSPQQLRLMLKSLIRELREAGLYSKKKYIHISNAYFSK